MFDYPYTHTHTHAHTHPGELETKSSDASADTAEVEDRKARPPRYRPRRSTSDRLRDTLLALSQNAGVITRHEESPWSSITFTGSRHEVVLDFTGHEAVEAGETFIAELPEHEFTIPGQLVADASVREVDHRFGADERMIVTCVLLLLEDV
ncbi:MAG: hypothetical protein AAF291_11730 [Pseudomonadota bacterium]